MRSVSATSKIASGELLVKSRCPDAGKRPLGLTQSGFQHSHRPDVLSKMPRSCNVVFDLLRIMADGGGKARASVHPRRIQKPGDSRAFFLPARAGCAKVEDEEQSPRKRMTALLSVKA